MSLWKKIAFLVASLAFGVALLSAGFFALAPTFMDDVCVNEVFSEYLAPDTQHKAVIFERDCGATTGVSTQISIIGSDDKLANESGNVFAIEGNSSYVAPEVSWLADDTLLIHRKLNGAEFVAESSLNSIKIVYGEAGD